VCSRRVFEADGGVDLRSDPEVEWRLFPIWSMGGYPALSTAKEEGGYLEITGGKGSMPNV